MTGRFDDLAGPRSPFPRTGFQIGRSRWRSSRHGRPWWPSGNKKVLPTGFQAERGSRQSGPSLSVKFFVWEV